MSLFRKSEIPSWAGEPVVSETPIVSETPEVTEYSADEDVDKANSAASATASATNKSIGLLAAQPTSAYVAPSTEATSVNQASEYSTPETTISYQLNKLLDSNGEYLKQAAEKAKITASDLGMLSSDRYIGAARGAAIREALPIATADATTASKFQLQQQAGDTTLANTQLEGLVSAALNEQQYKIDTQLKKTSAQIDVLTSTLAFKNSTELAGLNSTLATKSSEYLKKLDADLNESLLKNEYTQKTAEAARAQAASQIENTMITIENTIKNPDLLQLGSAAVAQIVNNEIALMKGGIELTYNLAKLNVDDYVTNLLTSFESQYKWATT